MIRKFLYSTLAIRRNRHKKAKLRALYNPKRSSIAINKWSIRNQGHPSSM